MLCSISWRDQSTNTACKKLQKIPGFSGDHSSVLKRDSISPHTSYTCSMMAIAADRCSQLFHAQIERGTLFRLKDNALFPVLRGEQCTHENRITRIKRADKRPCWVGKKARLKQLSYFMTATCAIIFILLYSRPFNYWYRGRNRTAVLCARAIAEICSRHQALRN